VVLAESHLAIHTWPERTAATLDVYVCNFTADNSDKAEKLYAFLCEGLKPEDTMVERIWRGRDLPLRKTRLAAVK
jgi:S-adenosylmethionine/arginine decarboxylase-like enzyme